MQKIKVTGWDIMLDISLSDSLAECLGRVRRQYFAALHPVRAQKLAILIVRHNDVLRKFPELG